MKPFFLFLSIVLATSFFHCDKNQDALPITKEELREDVIDEMNSQNISGLSLIVTKDDQVLVEEYLGQADRGKNIAVDKETKFLLASISKTVAATALMQLYEQDSFDLDDSINDYLTFAVNPPNTTTAVTFRMLLQHTSGIADGPSLDDEYYSGQDSPKDLGTFLSDYFTPGRSDYNANDNFTGDEPGAVHNYSNVGAALVGHLVETITGVDFDVYCNNNIFQPSCMNASSWKLNGLDTTKIAQPYEYENGNFEAIGHYSFTDYPNGGLRATASDLARFVVAYQQGGQYNGQSILKTSTVDLMLTEYLVDGENGVGLHWFTYDRADRNLWGHDGGEKGTTTMMGFNKATGIGVVILCNATDADLDEIMKMAYDFVADNDALSGTRLGC